jgi:hypothetical protein
LENSAWHLVYHHDYLTGKISSDHILYTTELFRNRELLSSLKELVICGLRTPTSVISPTGLPPDIQHTIEIRNVSVEVERILEERSILANSVTPQLIATMMDSHYTRLRSIMRPGEEEVILPESNNRASGGRRVYHWGGGFHFLPENYALPKVGLHIIWQHWWTGNHIY